MAKMQLVYSITLITVLLALVGCTGGSTLETHHVPKAKVGPASLSGISLPDDRQTNGLTETLIRGKFTLQRSAGAVDSGTALALDASASGLEWGTYGFTPGMGNLDSLAVQLDSAPGNQVWIGLGNYTIGSWEWHGPFSAGKVLAIDSDKYISPGGVFVATVVVAGDNQATVNALSIRTINPQNQPPTALLDAGILSGNAPLTVLLDAGGSSDPDGQLIEYAWDWDGDGLYDGFSDSPIVTRIFSIPGLYTVRLRVTDDQFARDTAEAEISVTVAGNNAPVADLQPTAASGKAPLAVSFNATGSSDADGTIVLYEWDFDGDGNYDGYGADATIAHTYTQPGQKTAKVRVTDNAGAQATDTSSISVHGPGDWWMFGHDLQHTRRSPFTGPSTNAIKWSYNVGNSVRSSAAIGGDGTVYVGCDDNKLYAINSDGSLKWGFTTGDYVRSSPAIGSDGTVYVGSYDFSLYAINPDGSLKWSYATGDSVYSSPAIGADGTVYVGSNDNMLYAINPDGSNKWSYTTASSVFSSPAIGVDQTVYVGSGDFKLYAINPNGSLKWEYTAGGYIYSSPAIGTDGTVYIGSFDDKLHAVNPNGSFKWAYTTGSDIWSSPAIGADGKVYVGSDDNNIYAINPDGSLEWAYLTGSDVTSAPTLGADGTVYGGSWGDDKVHAINPDGSLKWDYETTNFVQSSVAIGADGTVYVGSLDGSLYAFGPGGG